MRVVLCRACDELHRVIECGPVTVIGCPQIPTHGGFVVRGGLLGKVYDVPADPDAKPKESTA